MKSCAISVLLFFAIAMSLANAAPASESMRPVDNLKGRYSLHFRNGTVGGRSYWSDDVVEIVPVSKGAAYVRAHLEFYNGHECNIWGVAEAERNELVYRDPQSPFSGPRCVLHIFRSGNSLKLDDKNGGCKGYCGVRGGFNGDTLPFASRRSIHYMVLLKSSRQYREALKDWHSNNGQ
jgi:hypothetical protein